MQNVLDNIPKQDLIDEIERLKPDMLKRLKNFPGVPGVAEAMDYTETLMGAIQVQKEPA